MAIDLHWLTDIVSRIPHALRVGAQFALKITKAIENILGSNEVQKLNDAIPGDWDDKQKAKAQAWLAGADKFLQQAADYFPDPEHQALAKNMVLAKTQSYFTALPDNFDKKESEYDKAAQLVYNKQDKTS